MDGRATPLSAVAAPGSVAPANSAAAASAAGAKTTASVPGEEGESAASVVAKAHAFAQAAEDYTERGSHALAVEAHFRAAEQFLLATNFTTDPEASRTLRMLYASHTRQGKDLQRRLSRVSAPSAVAPTTTQAGNAPSPEASTSSPVQKQSSKTESIKTQSISPTTVAKGQTAVRADSSRISKTKQSDDIYLLKQQQQAKTQNIWNDAFDGAESSLNYGSRHFFVGQGQAGGSGSGSGSGDGGGSTMLLGDAPADNTPPFQELPQNNHAHNLQQHFLNKRYSPDSNSNSPATIPVESLDSSVFVTPTTRGGYIQENPQTERKTPKLSDTIDRSYYVLEENQAKDIPQENDEQNEDPFNKFWDVVENLVQKISVVPLQAMQQQTAIPQWGGNAAPPIPSNNSGGQKIKGVAVVGRPGFKPTTPASVQPKMFENLKGFKSPPNISAMASSTTSQLQQVESPTNSMLNSYFVVPSKNSGSSGAAASYLGGTGSMGYDANQRYPEGVDVRFGSETAPHSRDGGTARSGNSSGGGIALSRKMRTVGGGSEARNVMGLRAKTIEELQMENEQLKQTVDYLSKKVQALEKAGEENNLLKSSIMQFQQDVQRQAKRYGVPGSHAVTAGSIQQQRKQNSSTNISQSQSQSPATIPGSDISLAEARAAINRVSMLEAELSAVNQSHAKQIEELTKYKDRWFKVKETARKKKDIKVAAATDVSADEVAIGEKGSTGAGAGGGGGDRSLDVSITSSISSAYVNNHRTTPTLAAEESGGGAAGSPVRRPLSSLSTATRMPNANYGISNMSESEQPSRTAPSIPVVYQHEYEQSATGVSLLPPAGEFSGAFSSQLNTPVASTLGLFRVDTAPAATPSASIVMDTSAALLSAQLRDPRANSDSSQRSIQPHSADMSNLEDEAKQQGRIAVKSHPPSETSESVTSSGMFYSAFS